MFQGKNIWRRLLRLSMMFCSSVCGSWETAWSRYWSSLLMLDTGMPKDWTNNSSCWGSRSCKAAGKMFIDSLKSKKYIYYIYIFTWATLIFGKYEELYQHQPIERPLIGSSSVSTSQAAEGLPLRCQPGRQWVGVSCQGTKCPKESRNRSLL